jgi:hypothetical protein
MAEETAIAEQAAAAANNAAEVATALATHESDDAEDYLWLTERLDALQNRVTEVAQMVKSAMERMNNQPPPSAELREAMEATQQLNRQTMEMLTTTQAQLTTLAESVSLRLTPPISTNSSQAADSEPTPEPTPANPADAAADPTPEPRGGANQKGRRRI